LFGAVLYVVGPLVLALIPISGVGQLGKAYAVNVMIWNAWGILYAVFGALITAVHVNEVNDILGNGFLGFLKGAGDSVLLGLVSIFYALAVALIPFIAKKIISGDVGSTAFALVRAGGVAAGAALTGVSGFAAGAGSGATTSGGVSTSSTSTVLASSSAPPTPSMPDFIRSGVASAMNSNISPTASPSNANNYEGTDKRELTAAMSGASRHGSSYRPHSVTQVVSFNVGRALGRAAGRNNAKNN
jgi:hypothetical protein